MARLKLPPRDYVRQLLRYDGSVPGGLIWRPRPREMFTSNHIYASWNGNCAHKIAGYFRPSCVIVCLNNMRYRAHRLVWLIVRGEPVPDEIDHIDCDPWNNRIRNLRAATHQQNTWNSRLRSDNTTGVKGVSPTLDGRFAVFIGRDHYGDYATLEEAAEARRKVATRLHGKFVRHE